jgi:predicted Zn finger-like uncharacterized protein
MQRNTASGLFTNYLPGLLKEAALIVQCEKCGTTYHLDQTLLDPFGSKVRCTRCQHVFWVESSMPGEPSPSPEFQPEPAPPVPLVREHKAAESEPLPPAPGKKTRWGFGILVALILAGLFGRYFYIQYLHPGWSSQDILSAVFFLTPDPEGNLKISLVNIKKYFKENQKAGRFFVVEGEVKNNYSDIRQQVKIRGSLRTADNKVAVSRDVYAGWALSPEELENLSFDDINRMVASQPERFSTSNRIPPGKTLPFMIIFPPLPPGSSQVSIEVLSSKKIQSHASLKAVMG